VSEGGRKPEKGLVVKKIRRRRGETILGKGEGKRQGKQGGHKRTITRRKKNVN